MSATTSLISSFGRNVWRWWWGELRDLVPIRIRNAFNGSRSDIIVEIEIGMLRVTRNGFHWTYPLGPDPAAATRRALNAVSAFRVFAPRICLRLPHTLCLVRHVSVPQAARHRLAEIVRLDLASGVPMAPEDYLAAYYEDDGGAVAVILKRHFAEEGLALLAKAGYPASALDVWSGDGRQPLPVNLLPPPPGRRRIRHITQALLFAAIAVFAVSLGLAWHQRGTAIADLDRAIAEARRNADRVMAQAASANTLTEALATLRKRKATEPTALAYWEEIARLLPDTSSLSNLSINDGRVVMTGLSSSSPELIGTLERSPFFADAGFSSPVTFDQSVGAERFTIGLVLEQEASENAE